MSDQVFQKAASRPEARPHVYGSVEPYQHQKLGGLTVPTRSVAVVNRFYQQRVFNPIGGVSTAFASGGFTDIEIRNGDQFVTSDAWLKLNLTDLGAGSSICPSPLLIQRVEVYGNGGALELQRIPGRSIFFTWLPSIDRQDLADWAPLMRMNAATYGAGAAIGAGATVDAYIPLLGTVFYDQIFLAGLQADMMLRIYWNPLAVEAGVMPTCNSCQLLLGGYQLPPADNQAMMQKYRNNKLDWRVLLDREAMQSFSVAANQLYNRRLEGVHGVVTQLWFLMQNPVQSGSNLRQALDYIASHELKNHTGSSLTSGRLITTDENRYMLQPKWIEGNIGSSIPVQLYCWGDSQTHSSLHKSIDGFWVTEGTDQLDIRTNGSATGNVQLTVLYKQAAILSLNRGVWSVHTS
jgi:hypothetical protein